MQVEWYGSREGMIPYACECKKIDGKPRRRYYGRVTIERARIIETASRADARDRREASEERELDQHPPLDDVEVMLEKRFKTVMRTVTAELKRHWFYRHRGQWRCRGRIGRPQSRPATGESDCP
jgi:hypothetical protein